MSGSDSQPQGNRTSAEREAARKERERRRAQRRGVQPEQTAGAAQEQVETEAGTPERTDVSGGASETAQVAVHSEAQAVEETHGEPASELTQAWDLADDLAAVEHPAHEVASSAVASVEPEHPQPAS
ncbi:MAG: hypothetical protein WAU69_04740, partial [Solirubrobacteraceae bacterium]